MRSLLLVLVLLALAVSKEPVRVTLLVEAEDDEGEDFVQVQLHIAKQHDSLGKALSDADKLAKDIADRVKKSCQQFSKNKRCADSVEVEDPQIDTKYQIVRKESTFQHFIVKMAITFKVYKLDALGPLVDELQKLGVTKFEGFSWKNEEEKDEEEIVIQTAKERAANLCESFDHKFERIVEVTQIQPKEEEQEGEEDGDEEGEDAANVYQVVVECTSGKPAKK